MAPGTRNTFLKEWIQHLILIHNRITWGTLIFLMARTLPRPIKSDSWGLRPGNSNMQPSLRTHDFIHTPLLPYLTFLPHHNTNSFLFPPFPWKCFVKGYEFPSKKSLLDFSRRLSYLTFFWNVILLSLLFSWNNLPLSFIALFSPDFSPISLADASLPPLSYFSLLFPPFFFMDSNVWVFWETAFSSCLCIVHLLTKFQQYLSAEDPQISPGEASPWSTWLLSWMCNSPLKTPSCFSYKILKYNTFKLNLLFSCTPNTSHAYQLFSLALEPLC